MYIARSFVCIAADYSLLLLLNMWPVHVWFLPENNAM